MRPCASCSSRLIRARSRSLDTPNSSSRWQQMVRSSFLVRFVLFALSLTLAAVIKADKMKAQHFDANPGEPVQIVDGYPRFQFEGQPFFAHSAAFFYNRIPRDEWGASLAKLKSMGVNTIDLYIAWN